MLILLLLVSLLLLVLNAFFVLAEFSAVKMRPTRVEELLDDGVRRAKVLQHIQSHLDEYLSVCQVGITFASIGLGFVGKPAFEELVAIPLKWMGWASPAMISASAVSVAYVLVSFLHILLGELVPKSIAIRRTDASALWMSVPLRVAHFIFFIPLWILNSSANLVLRICGMSAPAKDPVHSEDEIRIILERSQTSGLITFRRLLLMENIFDLGGLKVRDAMKTVSGVKTLRAVAPWTESLAIIRETKFSRFPVMADGHNLPVGLVHVKDILHQELDKQDTPDFTPILRPFHKVTDDVPLEQLMAELQQLRRQAAIVVDRKGQWVGFITLEDVIEEIIGSVEDEFEKEPPLFLADTLSPERIILDVTGPDILAAIHQICARIKPSELPLPRERIERAVAEREKSMSTYLGHGVAVPHARIDGLERPILIFAQSSSGIPVASSTEKVHILFMLLTPANIPQYQVRLLARICGVMQSEYVVERLRETHDAGAILEILRAADPGTLG